jgi:acyl transferase domain-containing protein
VEGAPRVEGAPGLEREHGVVGAPGVEGVPPAAGAHAPGLAMPWVLSGKGHDGLRGQVSRLLEFVQGQRDLDLASVGLSLADRPAFEQRAVVVGSDHGGLLGGLGAVAGGESGLSVIEGVAAGVDAPIVFLFSGQGSQRVGMGLGLHHTFPVFAEALDGVCDCLDGFLGQPIREVLFAEPGSEQARLLDETMFTQAALFALEVALFRLVASWGVRPAFLMGHSIGEVAAAYVSGVFSLQDACALVAARGKLMQALPTGGAMVAVQASEQEVLEELGAGDGRVGIAAINGPTSVVLSGDEDPVLDLAARWGERGRKTKRLRVSHAFHSPRMDGMLEEFAAVLGGLSFAPPQIPIVSNLTGQAVSAEAICNADHWVRHVREPVRFVDGVRWVAAQGASNFLELGVDGALSAMVGECLAEGDGVDEEERLAEGDGKGDGVGEVDAEESIAAVPALRTGRGEPEALLTALARMWVRGGAVDWARVFHGTGARRLKLPTYAFQRERFWLDGAMSGAGDLAAAGQVSADHPLVGAMVELAGERGWLFTGSLSLETHPWLADHVVMGIVLLPGAAFVELGLWAAGQVGCEAIEDLTLQAPLVLEEHASVELQVSVGEPGESGEMPLSIHSRVRDGGTPGAAGEELAAGGQWTCHATGVLVSHSAALSVEDDARLALLAGETWPPPGAERVELDGIYDRLAERDYDYGPRFQGLRGAWRHGEEVLLEVSLPAELQDDAARFALHPALLDSALHAVALDLLGQRRGEDESQMLVPFSWSRVGLSSVGASTLRVSLARGGEHEVSLLAVDGDGALALTVGSLVIRAASPALLGGGNETPQASLLCLDWTPIALPAERPPGPLALLHAGAAELVEGLAGAGVPVQAHLDLASLGETSDNDAGAAP